MLKNSIEGYSEMDISTKNPCKLQGLAGGRKVREMTRETLPLPLFGPSNEAAAVSRITDRDDYFLMKMPKEAQTSAASASESVARGFFSRLNAR